MLMIGIAFDDIDDMWWLALHVMAVMKCDDRHCSQWKGWYVMIGIVCDDSDDTWWLGLQMMAAQQCHVRIAIACDDSDEMWWHDIAVDEKNDMWSLAFYVMTVMIGITYNDDSAVMTCDDSAVMTCDKYFFMWWH